MEHGSRQLRDEWIALGCKAGDPKAFEAMVREFESPLLYYAAKLLRSETGALDVLQEVWMNAMGSVRKLENPKTLRAWLYRLTHARAVDRIRQERSRQRAEEGRAVELSEVFEDDATFAAAEGAEIHRLLDQLSIEHREVLVLHFLDDLPVDEIAEVVGVPAGTVKSRLHYAKHELKKLLTRGGQ
jgi:RNA polymerase sigma-70 factor, ECF subfamily